MKQCALILAGGKASRMNYKDKAGLLFRGESFLASLYHEFEPLVDQIVISEGKTTKREYDEQWDKAYFVRDIFEECGPLGGVHAALSKSDSDLLFVSACDMPKLKRSLYEYLLGFDQEYYDAIIPTLEGSSQPLAGIYKKRIFPVVEGQLNAKQYGMRRLLSKLNVCYVEIKDRQELAAMVENINTMKEYEELLVEAGR